MPEATLTFKQEEREGIIPVGTYLSDAAARFGVRFEGKCVPTEGIHFCQVSVDEGAKHLSTRTAAEVESLDETAGTNERLACQAKVIEPGEIFIMTKKKEKADPEEKEPAEKEYTKEFAEMPLEKKFAELMQLEAITLSETFSFILNSPYLVFDKVMDVMADFGLKKEENGKKATRPAEHAATDKPNGTEQSKPEANAQPTEGPEAARS